MFKEKAVRLEADGAMPSGGRYDSGIDNSLRSLPPQQPQRRTQLSAARVQNREVSLSIPQGSEGDIRTIIESMVSEEMSRIQEELRRNSAVAELRQRDEEITELRTTVKKLERTVQTKSAELEERDFRLSLIENSNYDGTMICMEDSSV
jgi:hypothetical protein